MRPRRGTSLQGIQAKYETTAKLARHPEHLERSPKQETLAPLVVGLVMKFGSEQYLAIRDARNYFSQERPFAELTDDYLGDLSKLIKFASKVFDPGTFVPFGLSRLETRIQQFMKPLYETELPIIQQAHLHRTALYIQQNGHPPEGTDIA
jgi:hypothetical protein